MDDDGLADAVVGAAGFDAGTTAPEITMGKMYQVFGTYTFPPEVILNCSASVVLTVMSGPPSVNAYLGRVLAGGGNVDGDGFPDIAVGAKFEDAYTGKVFVIYHKALTQ